MSTTVKPGLSLQLPEEAKAGQEAILKELRQSSLAFKAATQWAEEAQQKYFQYYRDIFPELEGWTFSVKHETGAATVLYEE